MLSSGGTTAGTRYSVLALYCAANFLGATSWRLLVRHMLLRGAVTAHCLFDYVPLFILIIWNILKQHSFVKAAACCGMHLWSLSNRNPVILLVRTTCAACRLLSLCLRKSGSP